MANLSAKHALPSQENSGDFVVLGTLAEIVCNFKTVIATANGVLATDNDDNKFFINYSKKVIAEIKAGNITLENMGHLEVAESNYKDEKGNDQVRLKLTVPMGYSGNSVSGVDLAKISTTAALAPKTISLQSFSLIDAPAPEPASMKVVHSNLAA